MALVKCPRCGHTVLSVASACPKCSGLLTQEQFPPSRSGALTECRSCGRRVLTNASACLHCGVRSPGRRGVSLLTHSRLVRPGIIGVAVVLGVVAVRTTTVLQSTSDRSAMAAPTLAARSLPPDSARPGATSLPRVPRVQTKWTSTWVNVRQGQGGNTAVVEILKPGQPVEVSNLQGGWWSVQRDGRHIGYVANALLRDERP